MMQQMCAALRDIADDIRARPGRAGLSFLALGVGMTALTVLFAVLGGLQERARRIVEELGAQVFVVTQNTSDNNSGEKPRLSPAHVDLLAAHLPGGAVSGAQQFDGVPVGGDRQVRVVATDADLIEIRPWRVTAGRFLDAHDVHHLDRVAVASEALARDWNWQVGDVIQLRDTPFRLVGLLRISSGALESETSESALLPGDRVVFVPRTLPPYWATLRRSADPRIDALFVKAPADSTLEQSVDLARALLTQPDQRLEDLAFLTPEVLLHRLRKLQDTIRFTAGSIAVLCLVLGGTTLMSLLVANVRERVVEIGLRRALGGSARDIAGLFVLEAVLLTGAAALAGSFSTTAVLWLSREHFPVPLRLDAMVLLAPLFLATGLGAAFSFWPARAAARIVPAEALRNE